MVWKLFITKFMADKSMTTQLPKTMSATPDVSGKSAPGRFQFASTSKGGGYLVDTATGATWSLQSDGDHNQYWLPLFFRSQDETFESVLDQLNALITTEASTAEAVRMATALKDAAVAAAASLPRRAR